VAVAAISGRVTGWSGWAVPAPIDEQPVWAIVCFMVRPGYRRQGVARALLVGAVEFARQAGVPALEAYPVDPEGHRVSVTFGYVGFTPMFEAAGFRPMVETDARSAHRPRILMRLELANGSRPSRTEEMTNDTDNG
jgi:GNAT superfamily N-acetyltransferase